ncbi:MAG: ABC transporter ATP-binding protein [Chitinophagales bacterium]|nr:ABC transporter ATP-binding protein [Chitinophagales bacterium]
MSVVIKAEGLSKNYNIGKRRSESLRETITDRIGGLIKRNNNSSTLFKALDDVSFEIKKGEAVAVIGRNGAGKSTLLKILSRITDPSSGRVVIEGRVSSLLEVGTGFHPELTGRENIFLNGAILGMRRAEIKNKFEEIVAFSGIESFIDTPVKRYSSGMYVRLAFAVAAHLEPEILIVDEVLAVGDAEFQKKCLGKMKDVSEHDGRTVIFVSHNMEAVQNLCKNAMLLKQGKLIAQGEATNVVGQYLHHFLSNKIEQHWSSNDAPGNSDIKLISVAVSNVKSNNNIFYSNDSIKFEFTFELLREKQTALDVTFHLVDERGILVLVASTVYTLEKTFKRGRMIASTTINGGILNQGSYSVQRLIFLENKGMILFEYNDTLTFEILPQPTGRLGWTGRKEGVIFLPQMQWTLEQSQ